MRLLIRADGTREIGFGHVMRTMALAQQAKKEGDNVALASCRLDPSLAAYVRENGVEVVEIKPTDKGPTDVDQTAAVACDYRADWVVVDGYAFDADFQRSIRGRNLSLLLFDDEGRCSSYVADLVLNQNPSATPELYSGRADHTRLLLGTDYVSIRQEFLSKRERFIDRKLASAAPGRAEHLLVMMGGSDPPNATARVIDALALVADKRLRVKVVIGGANPHRDNLVADLTDKRIELVNAGTNVTDLVSWADVAVTAAGSTTYELCFAGVPTMLVTLVRNQRAIAQPFGREGICIDLGDHDEMDPMQVAEALEALCQNQSQRAQMSLKGQQRIDGLGASRVLRAMRAYRAEEEAA